MLYLNYSKALRNMKIRKIKKGFTTNSSGSYEWLPGVSSTSSSTLFKTSSSSADASFGSTSPPAVSSGFGSFLLGLSLVTGIIAVALTVKFLLDERRRRGK
jgi:hypothetical protein